MGREGNYGAGGNCPPHLENDLDDRDPGGPGWDPVGPGWDAVDSVGPVLHSVPCLAKLLIFVATVTNMEAFYGFVHLGAEICQIVSNSTQRDSRSSAIRFCQEHGLVRRLHNREIALRLAATLHDLDAAMSCYATYAVASPMLLCRRCCCTACAAVAPMPLYAYAAVCRLQTVLYFRDFHDFHGVR
ncbi:hypothetical protein AK812_SmicGene32822 [Symbiodinium microadriaticum]|uniref:Uncharacterized protein n=1 Tax=Symbiodinium microadriaticum TaxID=2951 RepID=A0A1Q9CTA1_SYMMI|nr:hypothetical protein AK812_SmicGene32822 [Symbiodinium microadriaticum]